MSYLYSFQSSFFDGYFAVQALQLVTLAVLGGLSFAKCQGWNVPGSHKQTFFGFRIALLLTTFNALVQVISLAVLASHSSPGLYISIIAIIGDAALRVARAITAYALIRIAFAPLVAAGVFRRDKALAWGAAGVSGLISAVLIIVTCYVESRTIAAMHGAPNPRGQNAVAYRAFNVLTLMDNIVFLIIGAFGMGAAIHSLRKSRQLEVHPDLRRAVKMMIGAATVWTVVGVLYAVFTGLAEIPYLAHGGSSTIVIVGAGGSLISLCLDFVQQVTLYALLVAAFRKAKDILPL